MNYQEALDLKEKRMYLLGTIDAKGFSIDELIIVPKNQVFQQEFWRKYLASSDANVAILSYINEDLDVWAIDKHHLQEARVLFYSSLSDEQVK